MFQTAACEVRPSTPEITFRVPDMRTCAPRAVQSDAGDPHCQTRRRDFRQISKAVLLLLTSASDVNGNSPVRNRVARRRRRVRASLTEIDPTTFIRCDRKADQAKFIAISGTLRPRSRGNERKRPTRSGCSFYRSTAWRSRRHPTTPAAPSTASRLCASGPALSLCRGSACARA
jgi:hypothetical protein